jgi:homoserine kinase
MTSLSAFRSAITVQIPATSANLGPGFDSLGLALGLYNRVLIADPDDTAPLVKVHTSDAARTPSDEGNISYAAARALFDFLESDVQFRLEAWNDIPHGRGLGSSAAARVGGLVAANEWARARGWRTASNAQLIALAAAMEGHPDNAAAALLGGLTVSGITDSGAVALPLAVARWPRFVVWIPDTELATAAAREALPEAVTHHDAVFNVTHTALLLASLASGDWSALPAALDDRLHQPQRAALIPDWEPVGGVARRVGALGITISGSGSTLLLWLQDDAMQARALEELSLTTQKMGLQGRALALEVDVKGARVLQKPRPRRKRIPPMDLPVPSEYVPALPTDGS